MNLEVVWHGATWREQAAPTPAPKLSSGPYRRVSPRPPTETEAAVYRVLVEEALSKGEIERRTGLTHGQVRHAVERLIAAGRIEAIGARGFGHRRYRRCA